MSKLKAILIDDEQRAISSLTLLLQQYCPEVEIIDAANNIPEGVIAINKGNPDVVFLDIDMPEYSGFEIMHFFQEIKFEIIFVTAYNEYALRAFEVSALDYILKPVDIDKLKSAVQKALDRKGQLAIQERLTVLKESLQNQQFSKIALPMSDGVVFIQTKKIAYLEADGAYTRVWLTDGSKILVSKKLKFFEEVLDNKPNFFRSHRSYMINVNYIKKYSKSDSVIVLENDQVIAISRERKQEFESSLKENGLRVG